MSQLLSPLHTPLALTQLSLVSKVPLQEGRADKNGKFQSHKFGVTFPLKNV
jgi:hypothetical protein